MSTYPSSVRLPARAPATTDLALTPPPLPHFASCPVGEKGVVFFTYPRANTPGCTAQACLYRDVKSAFSEQGYSVYGLVRVLPPSSLLPLPC